MFLLLQDIIRKQKYSENCYQQLAASTMKDKLQLIPFPEQNRADLFKIAIFGPYNGCLIKWMRDNWQIIVYNYTWNWMYNLLLLMVVLTSRQMPYIKFFWSIIWNVNKWTEFYKFLLLLWFLHFSFVGVAILHGEG